MQTPSGQTTAPPLQALLADGALAGQWILDPGQSSIRLQNRSVAGLLRVTGVFREVSGNGTVSPDGEVRGQSASHISQPRSPARQPPGHLRSLVVPDTGRHRPQRVMSTPGARSIVQH